MIGPVIKSNKFASSVSSQLTDAFTAASWFIWMTSEEFREAIDSSANKSDHFEQTYLSNRCHRKLFIYCAHKPEYKC